MDRTTWPAPTAPASLTRRVGIVVVNYNTRELIAQLLYSIFRCLDRRSIEVVVVDNGSIDGSREILSEPSIAKFIHVILNDTNQYHGPGLNQGISYLAQRQAECAADLPQQVQYVWVLDSDCVVMRTDVLEESTLLLQRTKAALAGQFVEDQYHAGDTFGLHSLLMDPFQVWRNNIAAFEEHGNPSESLQQSVIDAGLAMSEFAFTRDGYVIHLGRGTLAAIASQQDITNQYFDWAQEHNEHHFALEPSAPKQFELFRRDFLHAVPNLSGTSLSQACELAQSQLSTTMHTH